MTFAISGLMIARLAGATLRASLWMSNHHAAVQERSSRPNYAASVHFTPELAQDRFMVQRGSSIWDRSYIHYPVTL